MRWWMRPVSLVNGRIATPHGIVGSIRFSKRVLGLDGQPERGDVVVDLDGAFVLPGLINAHDHLELNHYGPLKSRPQYLNATEWIDDMRVRLASDPAIRAGRSRPLGDRLLAGGLKNLLAGTTTVAHHNPFYRDIRRRVPVKVVRRYSWAHSFALEGQPVGDGGERGRPVVSTCLRTPTTRPFMVHAGEGVDDRARDELTTLARHGCMRPNTILVHGVACTEDHWRAMVDAGTSLVWCPGSNHFLFGATIPAARFLRAHPGAADHLCLATDSRITGTADLLAELNCAATHHGLTAGDLLRMVTSAPARALGVDGSLAEGSAADLIVIARTAESPAAALVGSTRADVELVVVDGRPVVGTPRFEPAFAARRQPVAPLGVDGRARVAAAPLVKAIRASSISETGVECR